MDGKSLSAWEDWVHSHDNDGRLRQVACQYLRLKCVTLEEAHGKHLEELTHVTAKLSLLKFLLVPNQQPYKFSTYH